MLLGSHVDEFIIMKNRRYISHNPSILQPVMNNAADIIPGVGMTLKGYAVWLSIKMYTFAVYSFKCQCVTDLGVYVDRLNPIRAIFKVHAII